MMEPTAQPTPLGRKHAPILARERGGQKGVGGIERIVETDLRVDRW